MPTAHASRKTFRHIHVQRNNILEIKLFVLVSNNNNKKKIGKEQFKRLKVTENHFGTSTTCWMAGLASWLVGWLAGWLDVTKAVGMV